MIPPSVFLIDDRVFPYLGVLQVAAVAREAGHEVSVLDLTGHSRSCPDKTHGRRCVETELAASELLVGDLASRSDLVGFYSMAALHSTVRRLLPQARAANPGALLVLGGPHATSSPDRCALEGWDRVVVSDQGGGGGEPGFLRVLAEASSGAPRRSTRGEVVRVPSREPGRRADRYDNDRWPYPARDLVDLESYRYSLAGRRYASVVTQTGCPFRCSFCSHWDGYTTLGLRSPAHVEGELRAIKRDYPWVRGVMFYDDEVNLRPDFPEFLATLERVGRELDLRYRAFWKSGRRWCEDDLLFDRVKAAGFDHLCTGAESGDPEVLRLVGKGATLEDNTNFVRQCARVGIAPKLFTQVGLPGETPESAERTARWLEEMAALAPGIDADVTVTTPTPGTPIYDRAERFRGLIEFDRDELDAAEASNYKGAPGQYRSFVSTPGLSREDVVRWRGEVERRFREAAGLAPLDGGKDDG